MPREVLHFPDDPRPAWLVHPVLALGNFDGLHRGHLKILERVKRGAIERGGTAMAMTFDPHPPRVVRPDKAPPLLMTKVQRLEALHKAGIGCVAVVRFTRELSHWDPDTFVRTVLVDWLHVAEVWVGANFLFGHERSGNFTALRMLGQRYGFRAEKIDPVRYKEFVVSSTRIRRLVAEGRMDEAAALLGHPYYIDGTVVAGRRRGREIGVPTANLETANELIPPNGVYATTVVIDGIVHAALTNIGVNPTFGEGAARTVETYVLRYDGDLYGREVRLGFVLRLRDERRFDTVEALKAQIEADRLRAERLFTRLSV
ncbi:MAG: bifunctional riboflavin kinase/FAD synthetase [Acidobacteria bacterium]|nr:bifunctional riboflavin kinase/FAD synthetase [Acidobacteriota bacterium]